ncbi:MAG: PA14 domain-containing protein [Planctomycetota bacterium]|nr:PA14 domain-containing protein [Planctomycetota bacterium]
MKALCTFGLVFAGSSVFSAQVGMPAQQEAAPDSLVLSLERNLCMQCHQAPEGVEDFLRPLAAPPLNHLGSRVTPSWLSAWLMDPQKMRPGTRMPNMLSGFPEDERRQIADDLAAYLLSMDGNEPLELLEVGADVVKEGEQLFTEIGCIACHAQAFADRELAAMTSVGSLRDQLLIPHQIRPSGLMPDMHLSEKEALSLASWLLREQQVGGPAKQQLLNGWKWHAYEYSGSSASGPDWETAEVFGHGLAEEIHPNYGGREDRYGLVFEGVLLVPEDGEYHFYVGSDDGSTLTIGEETLIDARFHQSHTRREQSHSLTAGAHPIRITYYEATGDDSLEAGWSGPGFEERPFAAEDVQHEGQVFAPLASLEIAPTADAQRGAQWFEKLRCAACHTSSAEIGSALNSGPAFDELVFDQGCLSEFPITGVPHYEWDSSERNELKQGVAHNDFLQARSGSTEFSPSKSAVRVATTMEAMQCTACHQRDGVGEPSEEQMRLFVGEGDLGEEGRIPPALTGVEAKLQPHWLAKVITNGEKVRPYMKTRMPSFGEQVGGVIARDLHANRRPMPALPQRDFDVAEVQMGREIAGTNGLACIVCHNMAGHKSPGIPGLDLATVADRLERSWFQQWLRNPHQMRSNTRMPVFWNEEGKSALTRLGEGDASVQINALWAYFSLGAAMPLPQGLITNPNVYSLIPMDRPLYFGTFMEGLSARVLTVGFPERVHLAFDQHNVRLAKVWRGEFMNGKGTWDGRAGELESPAGVEILDLPTGPPFAWSTDGSDWPTESGKDAGWRMVGQRRDADGNPTFRYRFEDVQVEESFLAKLGADGAYFERSFLLSSPQQATGLMRRWLDENGEIQVAAVEWTLAEGGYIAKIEEELKW